MVKRKVDPDRTMMSYLQEPVRVDNDYVLDSDYSSDGDEDKLDKKLANLDLDEDDEEELDQALATDELLDELSVEESKEDEDDGYKGDDLEIDVQEKEKKMGTSVGAVGDRSPCYSDLAAGLEDDDL